MRLLKIATITMFICTVYGCKSSKYSGFAVGNYLSNDTVKAEFVYKQYLLPPDSTVRYVEEWLPPQLQLLPDYGGKKEKGIPTEFLESASISLPEYSYEMVFKGKTATYIMPPYRSGSMKIKRKSVKYISGLIERITLTAGGDTVTYSTPEAIMELLKKSEQKYGNIRIMVDSTMFTGNPKP